LSLSIERYGLTLEIDYTRRDSSAVTFRDYCFLSSSPGEIIIPELRPGTYDLWTKPKWHLARHFRVSVGDTETRLDPWNPVNGDLDEDNCISILDYIALTNATRYGYSQDGDLNGDGYTNQDDYLILAANFGLSGDERPSFNPE
jgi:hypothetical protein